MNKKLLVILILLNTCLLAQPGKEAWHWYFGRGSTLDFSSGVPVAGPGNNIATAEGSASISDPITGNFIMGAISNIVFNKNGSIMSNGGALYGNLSTTQSDLIVPNPGNKNIYYVVTADAGLPSNKGVHYSIVDLSQGNFGKVTAKNKVLTPPPCTEKLAGARHCNGTDYWILTHPLNSNAINAYLVTAAGVDTVPVISNVGTPHINTSSFYAESVGYMKVSPNGKKLVLGIASDSIPIVEMFDFDNATGMVSNPMTVYHAPPGGGSGAYGVTFSPDNTKLYTNVFGDDSTSTMYQYDISSNNLPAIIASQTFLAKIKMRNQGSNHYANQFGALQIGPDGKIYISMSKDTLSVINNPNAAGLACNLVLNSLPLNHYYTYSFGLPNFIDANYAGIQLNLPDIQLCTTFTTSVADAGPGFSNYQWNTGATTQTISISAPGQYWVTVTNDQGCQRTDTLGAYVLVPQRSDTLACDTFVANVVQGGVLQYNWYDGNHNPIRDFTQSGNYYVDIAYINGCGIRDSIDLTVVPSPQISIGPDSSFCKGDLLLDAQCSTCTYQWSTGQNSSTIVVKAPGTYWVRVVDGNGCADTDTMVVHPQLTAFDFVMPNIVTPNDDNINDVIDFGRYQFSALQIQIFNRWGKQVFASDSADAVWKPVGDEGTYFYTGQYRINCDVDTQTKNIKGYITLVR